MPPTLQRRPPAHLRLWRRFHEALSRDVQRLAQVLTDRPDMPAYELAGWWDRFAPAVIQCDHLAGRLFGPVHSTASQPTSSARSTTLGETIENMGLAIGVFSNDADPDCARGVSSRSYRAELARSTLGLVTRHQADTVEYLTRSIAPDTYRTWERGAIAALAYRNVSFLAPWLLDEVSAADRNALLRDVPHIRVMRCDDVWMRRYQHLTAAIRQPGHRPDTRPA